MKPITKGLLKGCIQSIELFQGIAIGHLVSNMYTKINEQEHQRKEKVHKIFSIIMYVFILLSFAFIVREYNIVVFKNFIIKNMDYKTFNWPAPIMLGFGLLFFQDHLKQLVMDELSGWDLTLIQNNHKYP